MYIDCGPTSLVYATGNKRMSMLEIRWKSRTDPCPYTVLFMGLYSYAQTKRDGGVGKERGRNRQRERGRGRLEI